MSEFEPPIDVGGDIGGGGGGPPPPPPPSPTPPPPLGAPSPPPPPAPAPTPSSPQVVGASISAGQILNIRSIDMIATPSQRIAAQLGDQSCRIDVYQKTTGLYLDLYVSDVAIVTGILCLNNVYMVQDAYLGFTGDFLILDTQGADDPDYTGLGSRWYLFWVYPG